MPRPPAGRGARLAHSPSRQTPCKSLFNQDLPAPTRVVKPPGRPRGVRVGRGAEIVRAAITELLAADDGAPRGSTCGRDGNVLDGVFSCFADSGSRQACFGSAASPAKGRSISGAMSSEGLGEGRTIYVFRCGLSREDALVARAIKASFFGAVLDSPQPSRSGRC